ncbi:reverse transcriptase [Gossypium australe]|uniref:Reverse transcriptase n=1 Tax=Gossypium australe TaxID=47621 RepID=A0A5B6WHF2_9ROSI|nr:reverse transcriptase [Gossypium australe]
MLDRLVEIDYYCFLDGYSGYHQILEKTTFTSPFGIYAFYRMSFGICNAPTTFMKCMTTIFADMLEVRLDIFMDDFSLYGYSFTECLGNLERVLE